MVHHHITRNENSSCCERNTCSSNHTYTRERLSPVHGSRKYAQECKILLQRHPALLLRHPSGSGKHASLALIRMYVLYSGKYWRGFKFGGLTVFRKSTKLKTPPLLYSGKYRQAQNLADLKKGIWSVLNLSDFESKTNDVTKLHSTRVY